MALPFLVGNSFNHNIGKTKFHKSHHFDICNNVTQQVGETKPGIGGEPRPDQIVPPATSGIGKGTNQPTWVAFDQKVLSFDAFYQEAISERREETFRIHECKIYFYLEDDSIQVVELKKKNSGINQGTIIKRHRIKKPYPHDKEFYTLEDFNVNETVSLYSKNFKIVNCDKFTQEFLYKLGVRLQDPNAVPNDPYSSYRKTVDGAQQPLRPYQKIDTLKQFLEHDRHVLRFFCLWDDSENMFGDPHEMILHYFLADDTIEIREVNPPNSGRDATPIFIKRQKLPKVSNDLPLPGQLADRTVLNVFGSMHTGGRYILDSLKTGEINIQYYTSQDLHLGDTINVYGRPFLICDCDNFTREYYKTKFGISTFTPVDCKKENNIVRDSHYPPYNGFGSEEDSLSNCKSIIPKPPQKNFMKFMEKDKHGLESHVLQFKAKLDSGNADNQNRNFIISYYLSDDTISIFEPLVRNSGIAGGKFLERSQIKKPDQPLNNVTLSEYYKAQDLFIGQKVNFNTHKFTIIDADEYTFKYMESHPDEFPKSNLKTLVGQLHKINKEQNGLLGKKLLSTANEDNDQIGFSDLKTVICELLPEITDHELIILARHYTDDTLAMEIPARSILAMAQEQLRRANFEDYLELLNNFKYEDQSGSGILNQQIVWRIMLSLRVPLSRDLLRQLIENFSTDDEKVIHYEEFVNNIEWRQNTQLGSTVSDPNIWKGYKKKVKVDRVNYKRLLNDVNPDEN